MEEKSGRTVEGDGRVSSPSLQSLCSLRANSDFGVARNGGAEWGKSGRTVEGEGRVSSPSLQSPYSFRANSGLEYGAHT